MDGLKVVEPLDDQEKNNLSRRLEALRKKRSRTVAVGVLLISENAPIEVGSDLVFGEGIPIFNMRHEAAYQILGGLSAETLLAMLRELWISVGEDMKSGHSEENSAPSTSALSLDEAKRQLGAFLDVWPQHPASSKVRALLDELENSTGDKVPQRKILTEAKDALETYSKIGDAGASIMPRIIELIAQISKLFS